MVKPETMTAVVADIGGTNTRVALTQGTAIQASSIRRYRNAENDSLSTVLKHYLADQGGVQPDAACVDMAGPVRDGVGTLTNLDWTVDRDVIAAATGAKHVAVLNDLQAQGHSISHLGPDALAQVRQGNMAGDHAARLVVNVGTGFNAALVYRTDTGTLVPPSEAGHITLPIQTEEELRLQSFLGRGHGVPGLEEALSGRGLGQIYAWAREEAGLPPAPDHSAHAVFDALKGGNDAQAAQATEMFIRLLGRVTGNLTLVQLPFGGVYFCGGMALAVLPYFESMGFESAFLDKGRFSGFMQQFPVYMVTDDYAALTGSASHLAELLTREQG